MSTSTVMLKDGTRRQVEEGSTWGRVAAEISRKLGKEALAAKVDGEMEDLQSPAQADRQVEFLTFGDEEGRAVFRHTSSHILAQAVQRLFPGTKLAIGPAIADGFYYDLDSNHVFTAEDLAAIEAEMQKIVKEDYPLARREASREEAIEYFILRQEPYKVELIQDLPPDVQVSLYKQGEFIDLCRGPHLPSTGMVGAIKLLNVAGAYWRGSEKNKMLQRIYGTSFPKQKDLDEYLERIDEAKRRDHRKLGQELDLFGIADEGPGFPFFYPKGMICCWLGSLSSASSRACSFCSAEGGSGWPSMATRRATSPSRVSMISLVELSRGVDRCSR